MFLSLIGLSTHRYMTENNCKTCIRVSSKEFIKAFRNNVWEHSEYFKGSFFNRKNNSEIHADIFKINGVGYICKNVFEYRKIKKFIKNVIIYKSNIAETKEKIEERLNFSLKSLCSQLGIPLIYKDHLEKAAGRILYHSNGARLLLDNAKIEILNEYINEPYVLAHELGHYMAIKNREDSSEEGANYEAYRLCRNILSESEQMMLYSTMNIYFHQ